MTIPDIEMPDPIIRMTDREIGIGDPITEMIEMIIGIADPDIEIEDPNIRIAGPAETIMVTTIRQSIWTFQKTMVEMSICHWLQLDQMM